MDWTGFLFGNVNEDGELEDESVLDKVGRMCVGVRVLLGETRHASCPVCAGGCGTAVSYGGGGGVW